MIYTHVLNRGPLGERSPADLLVPTELLQAGPAHQTRNDSGLDSEREPGRFENLASRERDTFVILVLRGAPQMSFRSNEEPSRPIEATSGLHDHVSAMHAEVQAGK